MSQELRAWFTADPERAGRLADFVRECLSTRSNPAVRNDTVANAACYVAGVYGADSEATRPADFEGAGRGLMRLDDDDTPPARETGAGVPHRSGRRSRWSPEDVICATGQAVARQIDPPTIAWVLDHFEFELPRGRRGPRIRWPRQSEGSDRRRAQAHEIATTVHAVNDAEGPGTAASTLLGMVGPDSDATLRIDAIRSVLGQAAKLEAPHQIQRSVVSDLEIDRSDLRTARTDLYLAGRDYALPPAVNEVFSSIRPWYERVTSSKMTLAACWQRAEDAPDEFWFEGPEGLPPVFPLVAESRGAVLSADGRPLRLHEKLWLMRRSAPHGDGLAWITPVRSGRESVAARDLRLAFHCHRRVASRWDDLHLNAVRDPRPRSKHIAYVAMAHGFLTLELKRELALT